WTVRRSFRLAGVLLLGLLSVRRNLGALLVGAVRHPSFIDGARGAGFPMEGCGRAPHVEDLSALHLPLLSLPGVLCHSFGRPDSRTAAREFRAPTMVGGAAQRRPVRRPRLPPGHVPTKLLLLRLSSLPRTPPRIRGNFPSLRGQAVHRPRQFTAHRVLGPCAL